MVHTSSAILLIATIALRATVPSYAAPIDARVYGALIGRTDAPSGESDNAFNGGLPGIIRELADPGIKDSRVQIGNILDGQGTAFPYQGPLIEASSPPTPPSTQAVRRSELQTRKGGGVGGGFLKDAGEGAAGSLGLGVLGSLFNRTIEDTIETRRDVSSDIAGLTGAIEGAIPRGLKTRKFGGALKSAGGSAAGSLGLGILGSLFNRTIAEPIGSVDINGTYYPLENPNVALGRDVAKEDLARAMQGLGLRALKRELELELQTRAGSAGGKSDEAAGASSGVGAKGLLGDLKDGATGGAASAGLTGITGILGSLFNRTIDAREPTYNPELPNHS